jgi:hypothetical protein
MGCDIHLFIEVKYKNSNSWFNFGDEFRLNRNYWMFGTFCKGVRCEPEQSFEERGLPKDYGYAVSEKMFIYISEDKDIERSVELEKATRWIDSGSSWALKSDDGTITYVSDPDLHSHSWLTGSEYQQALEWFDIQAKLDGNEIPVDYLAVRSAMKEFELRGYETRVVFAFDN